ncbi:MAG TPA: sulfotransferase [Gammaproteobacteria bacterium]|nr:sulfotransferase [Gammaproteobacteria bacterium]
MLPNFVCIGAQKTGTTWLYRQLIQHPHVFLPATKELNFFYRDLSPREYEAHFARAGTALARGDISPNYMVLPGVAERMHAMLPDAKLICILREPLSRARSQFPMAVKLGNIPADMTFIQAFRADLQYLRERGQYLDLLTRFTRFYASEQIMILLYDDLLADPTGFLRQVSSFIGVDRDFVPAGAAERIEAGDSQLHLSDEDITEVRAFYAPHIAALSQYLGRSLQHWLAVPQS